MHKLLTVNLSFNSISISNYYIALPASYAKLYLNTKQLLEIRIYNFAELVAGNISL